MHNLSGRLRARAPTPATSTAPAVALGVRAGASTGSGDVDLEFRRAPRTVDADTGSGRRADRRPARPESYNVDVDTGSGTEDVDVPPRSEEHPAAARPTPARATSRSVATPAPRAGTSYAGDLGRVLQRLLPARVRRLRARRGGRGQALAAARLAGCPDGGELLDAPCGFGRHAIPLARAGYRVDRRRPLEVLLDEARRRAGGERWPKFVNADYRELPFKDGSFDAALNLYTSLGYLGDEEDTRALAAIRRVLRAGGRLVIETMHRDRLVQMVRTATGG